MKFIITVLRHGKKPLNIVSEVDDDISLPYMRKIFEAEQALNSLPGTNLRWHMNVEEELNSKK